MAFWHPGAPAPGLPFEFSKFENASEKSEKNWAETYASNERPWKFSTENTFFPALGKKDKFLTKNLSEICLFSQGRKKVIFCRKFSRVCDTRVCSYPNFFRFFRSIFKIWKIKEQTGCRCTRVPNWISGRKPQLFRLKKNRSILAKLFNRLQSDH